MLQAIFDPLGDFDFAFASQQLDRTHLTHVHAHGIGCASELGVDVGQRRFGFLLDVFVCNGGWGISRDQQGFGIGRLVVDLDAHVIERGDDRFDLLGVDHVIRQVVVDFSIGEVASLLTHLDQALETQSPRLCIFRLHVGAQEQGPLGLAVAF